MAQEVQKGKDSKKKESSFLVNIMQWNRNASIPFGEAQFIESCI